MQTRFQQVGFDLPGVCTRFDERITRSMKIPRLGEFRVLTLRELPDEDSKCDDPAKAAAYWHRMIETDDRHNPEVESLYGLCLSVRRIVTGYFLVAQGIQDTILAHPREVYRPALIGGASAIVLMHNHPSGDPTPSEGDVRVTRDMIRAGQLLKVDCLDHVIIGRVSAERTKDFCSLRELGYFYS